MDASCHRRSSWLVDDSQDIKARDLSSILRCLFLRAIEVGWNRDHSIPDRFV